MAQDRMTLTILEDGTAKLEVDGISGANHRQAEQLVAEFARLMGTDPQTTKRAQAHSHVHEHEGQTHGH